MEPETGRRVCGSCAKPLELDESARNDNRVVFCSECLERSRQRFLDELYDDLGTAG